MSLPLHDVGSVNISEVAHSYLSAWADQTHNTVVGLVRALVEDHVNDKLHVVMVADQTHKSKELGAILGDFQ